MDGSITPMLMPLLIVHATMVNYSDAMPSFGHTKHCQTGFYLASGSDRS